MPTNTYTPLATVALSGTDTSVEFANVPSIYRDIIAVIIGTAASTQGARLILNSDTNNNYTTVRMYGEGSGSGVSSSFASTYGYIGDVFSTSQTSILVQLMDYSASDKNKTFLYRMNNAGNYVMAGASRWASNTAVSNIKFELNNGAAWSIGTTISLYGVIA